jgi:integrase
VPIIGSVLLSDLHTRDVNRVLDPTIARGTPIAAARTFQMMRTMFRWAVGRGYLDRAPTDNMACPAESRPRERTLSPEETHTFWHNLHKAFEDVALQRILKLQLVLGQRVGEVAGMAKAEIDLERRLWTIPAHRTKNKHEHKLPLPPLAVEIIREALKDAGDSIFVFPNPKTGIAYPSSAVSIAVVGAYKKIGIGHFTSHDLRRTCADSMDALGVIDTIIGRVLNHRSIFKATVTQRHYITRSYEREMREALELWDARLRGIIEGNEIVDVISIHSVAAA